MPSEDYQKLCRLHLTIIALKEEKEGKKKKWNALCYCALVSQSIKSPLGDVCTMKELLNSELTCYEKKLNGQWWKEQGEREKHTSFQSLGSPLQEKIGWTNAWSCSSVIRATANWFSSSSSSSSKLTWSMLKACQSVSVVTLPAKTRTVALCLSALQQQQI